MAKSNPIKLGSFMNPTAVLFFAILLPIALLVLSPIAFLVINKSIAANHLTKPLAIGISFLAMAYGGYRGLAFHPLFDGEYCRWLARTPWTPKHPLPLGPLHLVRFDMVVLAALTLVSHLLSLTLEPPLWKYVLGPLLLFTSTITLAWSLANLGTGKHLHVYLVFFMPLILSFLGAPTAAWLLCLIAAALIAWHGVRSSLEEFPWGKDWGSTNPEDPFSIVGWPYRALFSPHTETNPSISRTVQVAVLIGGYVWIFLHHGEERDPNASAADLISFACVISLFISGFRLSKYSPVICNHLCLGLRFARRRLIIPEHDKIFLTPILIVLTGTGLPLLLYYLASCSLALAYAITAGAVTVITMRMGPSIKELAYTGVHSRFGGGPTPSKQQKFISTGGT